ncbi:MAG: hypothetical protein R3B93_03125 [Bacteroidia bacterium]
MKNPTLKTEETRFEIGGGITKKIFGDLKMHEMMAYTMPVVTEENLFFCGRRPRQSLCQRSGVYWLMEKAYGEPAAKRRWKNTIKEFLIATGNLTKGFPLKAGRRIGDGFIQYGKPGKSLTMTLEGKEYIKWIYPKWSLVFLFEKRNKRYILVE